MNKKFKVLMYSLMAVMFSAGFLFSAPVATHASGSITISQTSHVVVTFMSSSSDFNNEFGISSPITRSFGLSHNVSNGTTFDVGTINAGASFVLYLKNPVGETYYTVPSLNPASQDHAIITQTGTNQWTVGLEDQQVGGQDFNDIILQVTATPVPAPTYCADGHTMTASEIVSALGAGAVTVVPTVQTNQVIYQVTNTTGCTAPFIASSYIYFVQPPNPGWLSTQQFFADSGIVNINANGTTTITVPVSTFMTQADLWYGQAPHKFTSDTAAGYAGFTLVYGGPNTPGPLGQATNPYCANGTSMTPQEFNSAITAGKVAFSWNNSATTATAHITNATTCTVPLSLMSYKQFSWGSDRLDTSKFVATSGVKNLTANGATDISVPLGDSCLNIVALWYNQGPQQMHDADLAPTYGVPNATAYTPFNTQTAGAVTPAQGPLCTNGGGTITCSSNSDCGTNGYVDSPFCQNGNVYQNFKTFTCNNPGTVQSTCSSSTNAQLKNTCSGNQTCSNGQCVTQQCNPNWQCSNWSQCYNGWQNRNCTDSNQCGTNDGKPSTSQSCGGGSTCDWPGHCAGDSCQNENDCAGDMICKYGKCANPGGGCMGSWCNGGGNMIPNPSCDTGSDHPDHWNKGGWGNNNTSYSYDSTGHSGRGISLAVANYTDGDAKWFFDDVTVTPGAQYTFSDWYKSSISTKVTARYTLTNGGFAYYDLGTAPASSSWAQFSAAFTVPVGASSVSIFHLLGGNGTLSTSDFSLVQRVVVVPTGNTFAQGMVSLTFDDGWTSAYQNAFPLMDAKGIKGTEFIYTDAIGDTADGYMTISQILDLQGRGYEIGDHSKTHADLTTVTPTQLTAEVAGSKTALEGMGVNPISSFDYPYGAYNSNVVQALKNAGYAGGRTSDAGFVSKADDKFLLKAQTVESTTTVSQIESWISQAVQNKQWLILVIHQVDNSGGQYSITPSNFSQLIDYISQNSIKTVKMSEGLSQM